MEGRGGESNQWTHGRKGKWTEVKGKDGWTEGQGRMDTRADGHKGCRKGRKKYLCRQTRERERVNEQVKRSGARK